MDCDFCLDMDIDGDALSDYQVSVREAPEPFRCCECWREFPAGVQQERATGSNGNGEDYEALTCADCYNIANGLICGDRAHAGLWEAFEQMIDDGAKFTTACLAKVETASAKAYLVSRINELNGLRNPQ